MKRLVFVVFFLAGFIFCASPAKAALVTFTDSGQAQWNVLALTDNAEESILEVRQIASTTPSSSNVSVSLFNDGKTVLLQYGDGNDEKKVDLSDYEEEIIEIEERYSPRKLAILAHEDGFAIKQLGITALTTYPVKVSSEKNRLSVVTPTGERVLKVMPHEAVSQVIRSNILTNVSGSGQVLLEEGSEGEVEYLLKGKKDVILFKVFLIEVPISVRVSALSGNIMEIDQPIWYSLIGFFLNS